MNRRKDGRGKFWKGKRYDTEPMMRSWCRRGPRGRRLGKQALGQGVGLGKIWSEEYKATLSAVLRSTTFWFLIFDRKIRSNLRPSITIIKIAAFMTL